MGGVRSRGRGGLKKGNGREEDNRTGQESERRRRWGRGGGEIGHGADVAERNSGGGRSEVKTSGEEGGGGGGGGDGKWEGGAGLECEGSGGGDGAAGGEGHGATSKWIGEAGKEMWRREGEGLGDEKGEG